ncbi:MAG TPA: hypothetical protein DCL97_09815 [Dehalococcoidia bacterium]|jgi:uncharacterized protein (DUF1501 family)|uniref:DUF1501 domain-containing protein n=2 Tax=ecological metagenomes TaxID=410657 RepID=A0A160V617_9ZZZZ|nr:DUF1501 domain-containing protein [Chloroflexota bacterium]HAI08228.1 hypothetical protein [Dehalococcoidia bacterium]HAJ00956.1 hypothetical protein [Dehalococcoidia bacterium]|tara:strand:- start:1556 stop:2692 length:1137 start_codon:yes stop_codon:yes gene_type:complete
MASTKKDPVVVVLQLTGANDILNTIIPYNTGEYWDNRPKVNIPQDKVLPIDDQLAFNPNMAPLKKMYDDGKMAIIHGIGFENSPRSHFRAMDIWHTCEPDIVGTEGWVAKVTRDLDPTGENVLKTINFGQGLPRALALRGVPITSVSNLENYGVLSTVPGISAEQDRTQILDRFARMYAPAIGTGATMDYLGQTGRDALKGADILKVAPEKYSSTVEYAETPIAKYLRDVARVHLADLGTQVFYTSHGPFDTHFNQPPMHQKLWTDVSNAVSDFFDDLKEHDAGDNLIMIMFTEFGRRVRDNGTGTDHGAAGGAFVIGNNVKGGMYGTYPSLKAEDLNQGDLDPNYDFRGFYSTVVEKWLGLDPVPIVGGNFEQMAYI